MSGERCPVHRLPGCSCPAMRPAPAHAVTSMPERFYCICGYGMEGPKRTMRGLRTHVLRANSSEAGVRARQAR